MGDYNSDDGSGWAETENPLENLVQTSESSMLNNVVSLKNVISSTVSEATTSDDVSSDGPSIGYIISDENKWGWITLYVVTIVVAVLGNLLFIIGSLCTRRSRNTGHYLLINLSIRDILLAGLCIPATLDSEIIHLTWNLGLEFCISFRWAFSSAYQLISFTLDCRNFVCFVLFCSLLMIIRKSLCQPMWLIASLIKQMFYLKICAKSFIKIVSGIFTTASYSSCPWQHCSWATICLLRMPSGPRARMCHDPGRIQFTSLSSGSSRLCLRFQQRSSVSFGHGQMTLTRTRLLDGRRTRWSACTQARSGGRIPASTSTWHLSSSRLSSR